MHIQAYLGTSFPTSRLLPVPSWLKIKRKERKLPTVTKQVYVADCPVLISNGVKILCVKLDLQWLCAKCMQYPTCALWHIRSSLTADMAKIVDSSLVNTRFNHANAVFIEHLSILKRAQNALARVVTFTSAWFVSDPYFRNCIGDQSETKLTSRWQQLHAKFDKLATLHTWHHLLLSICAYTDATFVELAITLISAVTVDQNVYGLSCVLLSRAYGLEWFVDWDS